MPWVMEIHLRSATFDGEFHKRVNTFEKYQELTHLMRPFPKAENVVNVSVLIDDLAVRVTS